MPHEHVVADEVDGLRAGRLSGSSAGTSKIVSFVPAASTSRFTPPRAVSRFSTAARKFFAVGVAAGDVHRDCQRRVVLRSLDDRQTQLAGGDAFQVVPRECRAVRARAELILELLLEALDERVHHLVVEQLAELRLLESLLGLVRLGDRDVALGRGGQQHVAGRPGHGNLGG